MGKKHEENVLAHLRKAGWDAEPFGQGQLTDNMRNHLHRYTPVTPVRWMPDIIAARLTSIGRSRVVYIDAKAGDVWERTGNHDIEISALETAVAWEQWTKCPVYYVFSDFGVASPERVWECGHQGRPPDGFRTPFLLFPARVCEPFVTKFGAVAA